MLLVIALLMVGVVDARGFPATVPVEEQTDKPPIVSYANYKVYRVGIHTASHFQVIEFLLADPEMYNLWRMGKNEVDIMVNPRVLDEFHHTITQDTFDVRLIVPDVQLLIDAERANKSPNT
ncbi:uncharacterized protein LOC111079688 [Drosophila obscura]|uniref:uncharacterized protein LOC111079688 n=1 Tax=Drosophila obscura TaxID=7282 RepID=UPI001BB26EFD|nr:uncharacterized protein LOC111079688 [Drosophila obscura]